MKGYKGFNSDWTCRGFQYEVGETYEIEEKPECDKVGFHFCENLIDCLEFYDLKGDGRYAEVEATGLIDNCKERYCTNKITIVREIPLSEVLRIANTGTGNYGYGNTGDYNSGNDNSGRSNYGYKNIGSWNQGHSNYGDENYGDNNLGNSNYGSNNKGGFNYGHINSGNRNYGNFNTGSENFGSENKGSLNYGNCNTGNQNYGNYNTGNQNYGDFNTGNGSYGFFNTKNNYIIYMFNRPTELSFFGMRRLKKDISSVLATIMRREKTYRQEVWDNLSTSKKAFITGLPNFDPKIFKEITGVDVNYERSDNNAQE